MKELKALRKFQCHKDSSTHIALWYKLTADRSACHKNVNEDCSSLLALIADRLLLKALVWTMTVPALGCLHSYLRLLEILNSSLCIPEHREQTLGIIAF